jgi:hypothetical protein
MSANNAVVRRLNEGLLMNRKMIAIYECYRFNWCFSGFFSGWKSRIFETSGCFIVFISAFLGVVIGIASLLFYPVWRLIVEPIIAGLNANEKNIRNLKRINDAA